jgi:hypothetical protein
MNTRKIDQALLLTEDGDTRSASDVAQALGTDLSRRNMLRGMGAVACLVFAPAALYSATPARAEASASGVKKQPQASVKYQSRPNGTSKCAGCANFIAASGSCKVVEGKISPDGWCILWIKKT